MGRPSGGAAGGSAGSVATRRRSGGAVRSHSNVSAPDDAKLDAYRQISMDLREERSRDEASKRAMEKRIEDLRDELEREKGVREALESAHAEAVVGVQMAQRGGADDNDKDKSLRQRSSKSLRSRSGGGLAKRRHTSPAHTSRAVQQHHRHHQHHQQLSTSTAVAVNIEVDRLRDDLEAAEIQYQKERLLRQRLEVELQQCRAAPCPNCARIAGALHAAEADADALRHALQQQAALQAASPQTPTHSHMYFSHPGANPNPNARTVSVKLLPTGPGGTEAGGGPSDMVDIDVHERECERLADAARQAEADAGLMAKRLESVEADRRALKQRVAQLEADLRDEAAQGTARVQEVRDFCEEELRRCDTVHARQCGHLAKNLEACRRQRDDQIDRAAAVQDALDDATLKLSEHSATAEKWKAAAEESFAEVRTLQTENEALVDELQRLKAVRDRAVTVSTEAEDLRAALRAAQQSQQGLRERLRAASADYDALESDLDRRTTEQRRASDALRGTAAAVQNVHNEIASFRNALLATPDETLLKRHVLMELAELLGHSQEATRALGAPAAPAPVPAPAHTSQLSQCSSSNISPPRSRRN